MKATTLKSFAFLAEHYYESPPPDKPAFLRDARQLAREIAKRLGLKFGEYLLSTEPGGPVVSGVVTLTTDRMHVFVMGGPDGLMYQAWSGRGGRELVYYPRHWVLWSMVGKDLAGVILMMKHTLANHPDASRERASAVGVI